ncbi:MAG: hypothetical protein ACFFD1_13805 [Candidatus Thorarchaeota archaeon]
MKKVSLSINLAIIGGEDSGRELFQQYLNRIALRVRHNNKVREYLLLHENVPFKVKLYIAESIDQMISQYPKLKTLDSLIISINLYNTQSIDQYTPSIMNDFFQKYNFQGLTMLVALDSYYIEKGVPSEYFRISRLNLRKKTNQLNFIYCYEIQNKNGDIKEVLKKVLDDTLLKFQTSSPELLEYAKSYGLKLLSEKPN